MSASTNHLDQHFEVGLGHPAELRFRLGRIAEERIDFRRPIQLGIDHDVALVVELHVSPKLCGASRYAAHWILQTLAGFDAGTGRRDST